MARLQSFTPGSKGLVEITPQTIAGVEAYVRWAEHEVPSQIPFAMDNLVHQMALMNQSIARKMSFGPYDPLETQPHLAWRTPSQGIRRISNAYYLGWKVYKKGVAHYELTNKSREAYFIEFGISTTGFGNARGVPRRRIRRPVRKLSQLKTIDFMRSTQAFHRVWVDMYRTRHAHGGFTQVIQSPGGGHGRWEPASHHEAMGVIRRIQGGGLGRRRSGRDLGVRRTADGGWQIRRKNTGGGDYSGPPIGRKLPG